MYISGDYDYVISLKRGSWKRGLSLLPKVMGDWGLKSIPSKSIGSDLSSVTQHLNGGCWASSGKVSEDPNVGSGMVGLKQVTELGSHMLVSMSNSNSDTLSIDPEKLILDDLWACAYTDGVPLLSDDIHVDPFLGLKVFPGVAEHVMSSRIGISTCGIGKEVMQRLVQKSCEY
jgi:hypothetical protein